MLKVNHNIKNILLGNLTKYRYCIGGFHSILLHRTMLGGHLYNFCRFVACGSEQMSSNCIIICATKDKVYIYNK